MSSWRRWLLAITVLATVTRVAIIVATPHFVPAGDPADYQRHAVSIAAGDGYPTTEIATPGTPTAFRPPAYPYLLGGVYAVFGDHLLAGRLLGLVLGVLTVALLAYLGREIWSERVGLIAAGLAAVFLPLIALNATLLSESLLLPLELGFGLCLLRCWRDPGRFRWVVLAGALCGLSALTRSVADMWLLPALAVVAFGSASRRFKWRGALAVIGAFCVVVAPWTIRNAIDFHALVPISTEDWYSAAGQYNDLAAGTRGLPSVWRVPATVPTLAPFFDPLYRRRAGFNEVQLDGAMRHATLHYVVRHPAHVIVASALDTLRLFNLGPAHWFTTEVSYQELGLPRSLWNPTSVSAEVIALLALLVVLARAVGGRLGVWRVTLGPWWLWAVPLLTLALTVPFVGNPRKRAPLDPFLLLLASLAVEAAIEAVRGPLARRFARRALAPTT
ncbi:MAG TPA: glycosyltransferase family 39 protein [Solirubrobacteraceae bacterium]|jgi:4-amino-4-deoxy-L-arabinose transferase-like glycosyltransferase|nr:glycosyltransferase family 39 protein [Solirubrobacteraceae bacterium]